MQDLLPRAERLGALLISRKQTIAVSESSSGGLVAASLLAVPGASAYFVGGAVVYTQRARAGLLGVGEADMAGIRSATEPYALLLARTIRDRLGVSWGIAETGAAGPRGNSYGDPAGHTCVAISGPTEKAITIETGVSNRVDNMRLFALSLLELLTEAIEQASQNDPLAR